MLITLPVGYPQAMPTGFQIQIDGQNSIDCLVFLFLFYKKVYKKDPLYSGYQIAKAIKVIASSGLLGIPQRVSDKQVYESLDKLVIMNYIVRKKAIKVRKRKRVGRPPTCLYEVRSISAIMEKVKRDLKEKERRAMRTLESLGAIEEAVGGR